MPNTENKPDLGSVPEGDPSALAEPVAPGKKRKTTVAPLRALHHRGETVNTRWGAVTFDANGLAELELPEDEVPMLQAIKPFSWLASDHTSYRPTPKTSKPIKG